VDLGLGLDLGLDLDLDLGLGLDQEVDLGLDLDLELGLDQEVDLGQDDYYRHEEDYYRLAIVLPLCVSTLVITSALNPAAGGEDP